MNKLHPNANVRVTDIDSFDPASMEEAVKGASLEHVKLGHGRFQARTVFATSQD